MNAFAGETLLSRTQAEDFLFREARLLDEWKLMEWAELFTEDGQYLVPPLDDPDSDPSDTLFLIYDDHHRLTERAKRLLKKQAHAEFPHARLRRIVGNVFVEPGGELAAAGGDSGGGGGGGGGGAVTGSSGTVGGGTDGNAGPDAGVLNRVTCNFVVYRSRANGTEVFPGHSIYDLVVKPSGDIRIRCKRAIIDTDTLRSQRRVSIIL